MGTGEKIIQLVIKYLDEIGADGFVNSVADCVCTKQDDSILGCEEIPCSSCIPFKFIEIEEDDKNDEEDAGENK